VTLNELIAHLCPCLDCDVWVLQSASGQPELAHANRWHELDALTWLRQITFAGPRADEVADAYQKQMAPLLRLLYSADGVPCGRAAIGFGYVEAGVQSIGGLVSSEHTRAIHQFSMTFAGALGFEPAGPRRNAGPILECNTNAWASEQAALLAQSNLNEYEKYLAALNVAEFGGDPTPIAMILINRQPTAISKVYDMLQPGTPIFAVVGAPTIIQPAAISMLFHWRSPGHGEGLQWNELDFTLATMEAWHGRRLPDRVYHQIPTAETPAPSSFLSCLDRYAIDRKRTLRFEPRTNMLLARYKGEVSAREKLSQGTEFRSTALKLSLVEN